MILDRLRINQLSADGWTFFQRYLEALDRYDVDTYTAMLAEDVEIRFNSEEPIVGVHAARAGLGQFWASITMMGYTLLHEPLNIYGDDSHWVMEALNHYESTQRRITVRATAWTDRGPAGVVTSVRLYHDLSGLYVS